MSEAPKEDKGFIENMVSTGDVGFWMHYADHCDFAPEQKQAARHLQESISRLIRKRDMLDAVRATFRTNFLTGHPAPNAEQQHNLFDVTQDFFQTFHATLSSLSSFLIRVPRAVSTNPPRRSMRRFIDWIGSVVESDDFQEVCRELEAARAFRTILDHSPQQQPYDWATSDEAPAWPLTLITLFGPKNANGGSPEGSRDDGRYPHGDWYMTAPDEVSVTNSVGLLLEIFMPQVLGMYALEDSSAVVCPDFPWERERRKNAQPFSVPVSHYVPNSPHMPIRWDFPKR